MTTLKSYLVLLISCMTAFGVSAATVTENDYLFREDIGCTGDASGTHRLRVREKRERKS